MKKDEIPPIHPPCRPRLHQPPLARLLQSGLILLMLIGMQLQSYAVCDTCWEREYLTGWLADAQTERNALAVELGILQDTLEDVLCEEAPDEQEIQDITNRISEVTQSMNTADSIINDASQRLQNLGPCMMNPPCGQGVPQDPVYDDPPPPEDPPQDPPPYYGDPIPVYEDPPPPPDDPQFPPDAPPFPPADPDPVPV